MLKLGQGLAGDSPRAWRKATSHIGYKSPGHRYTENCLARVTATLSEDSLSLEDTVSHASMHIYIHRRTQVEMHWLENESMEKTPMRVGWRDFWLRTVSPCGS